MSRRFQNRIALAVSFVFVVVLSCLIWQAWQKEKLFRQFGWIPQYETIQPVMPPRFPDHSPSAAALEFGEKQVEQMVQARPEMGRYVHRGDPIWQYSVRQFAGEAIGEPIAWNSSTPENCPADHFIPYQHQMGYIRVAKVDTELNRERTCEELWSSALYELCNIRSANQHVKNWNAAVSGKIDEQEWIRLSSRLEYQAWQYTTYLHDTLWKPCMEAKGVRTTAHLWGLDDPRTYEQWISLFKDPNGYPWDPFGKEYENTVIPYLRQTQNHGSR